MKAESYFRPVRTWPPPNYAPGVLHDEVLALAREPGPPRPARAPWWDRALVAILVPLALLESLLRDDLAGRPIAIALGLVTVCMIALRRTHPFGAFAAAFGVAIVATSIELAGGFEVDPLHSSVAILLLPYSLFRWGAGREAAIGLAFLACVYLLSLLAGEMAGAPDAIGAAVVLLFPALAGAAVRFRANAHARELDHVKLREREQLARELHDTVAHHASAIVIQAQAGRAVAAARPEAALAALSAIEGEATQVLAELRELVGALRDGEAAAPLGPRAGIRDIARLARDGAHPVEVELSGELDGLRPMVQAAVYRLAQESITNAIRHARNASRILVRVVAEGDVVRLTVSDDGDLPRSAARGAGFGIAGMAERAALLGGSLSAGPVEGGWTVEAVLPRDGGAR